MHRTVKSAKRDKENTMARITLYVDDLDQGQSEDVQTRRFQVGDDEFEIDLSDKNWDGFNRAVAKYVKVATKVERKPAGSSADAEKNKLIREWGRKNGFEVSDRGRISAELEEAYLKAQANGNGNEEKPAEENKTSETVNA
jgi:hypothetical protein